MAIDWNGLAQLPTNPLFQFGVGMLANSGAAPYGTTLGQRLANSVGDVGRMQQLYAAQQYQRQQQADAEQDRQDVLARHQKLNDALTNGPYANNQAFQALAAANPEAAAAWQLKQNQSAQASPWQFDSRTGLMVNPQTGQFKPLTMGAPGQPGFTPPSPNAGLNASVHGANGQQVAFNFPPGTPPEVIAAAKADAVARGDITQAQAAQVGAQAATQAPPMTMQDYIAAQKPKAAGKPGLIQQRMGEWQQLAQAGAVDPTDTQLRNQYLLTGKSGGFQGSETAPTLGDVSKGGADYLDTLSPSDRDVVQSYIAGRQPVPTGTALKNPHIMSLVQAAYHADPELEAGTFNSRVKTRQAFTSAATANSPAGQIQTLNTASGHLNQLLGDVMRLDNGQSNMLNAGENYVSSKFGGTKFTDLSADLTPVASEIASLYKGGQATDAEIAQIKDSFPVNGSKGQQISVLEHWIGLLHSKLGALNARYTQGMGSMSDPLTTVNPEAASALQNITRTYKTLGLPLPSTIGETAHSVGGDAGASGPVAVNPQTGEKVHLVNGQWVKL